MATRRIFIDQTASAPNEFTVTIEIDSPPQSILVGEYGSFESAVDVAGSSAKAISLGSGGGFSYGTVQVRLLSTSITD
jgi:hypothetical protein